jgi:lipid-binding SYLF domain-containing protein
MSKSIVVSAVVAALGFALIGCGGETAPSKPEERSALQSEAQAALQRLSSKDATMQALLNASYGYAVFPNVGAGGAIVGGAYGRGVVYQQGRFAGYADLSQASIGLQLGGQTYTEIVVFQNKDAFDRFRNNSTSFTADAAAVAVKSGSSAQANFKNGVAVFTDPNGGLMANISVGGQRFTFSPAYTEPQPAGSEQPSNQPSTQPSNY